MILKFAIATSSLLVAFLVYNNKSSSFTTTNNTTFNIRRQLSFQERFIDPKSTFLRQRRCYFIPLQGNAIQMNCKRKMRYR